MNDKIAVHGRDCGALLRQAPDGGLYCDRCRVYPGIHGVAFIDAPPTRIHTPHDARGAYRTFELSPENWANNNQLLREDLARAQERVDEFKRLIAVNDHYRPVKS